MHVYSLWQYLSIGTKCWPCDLWHIFRKTKPHNNIWTVRARASTFHIGIDCGKTFLIPQPIRPWSWGSQFSEFACYIGNDLALLQLANSRTVNLDYDDIAVWGHAKRNKSGVCKNIQIKYKKWRNGYKIRKKRKAHLLCLFSCIIVD